jgi:hypothetical protein
MRDYELLSLALKREGVDEFPPRVTVGRIPLNELQATEDWLIDRELADLTIERAKLDDIRVEDVIADAVRSRLRLPGEIGGESLNIRLYEEMCLITIRSSDTLAMVLYAVAKARKNTSTVGLFSECLKDYLRPAEPPTSGENESGAEVHVLRPRVDPSPPPVT